MTYRITPYSLYSAINAPYTYICPVFPCVCVGMRCIIATASWNSIYFNFDHLI